MPFFGGAHNFSVRDAKMNDIGGDYTENKTTTEPKNSDSNNVYIASTVRKGNTKTNTTTIGNGDNNKITLGHSGVASNAPIVTPELLQLLQAFTAVPSQPPATPKSTPLPPDVSKSLGILQGLPGDAWTPDMIMALQACVGFIKSALAAANK